MWEKECLAWDFERGAKDGFVKDQQGFHFKKDWPLKTNIRRYIRMSSLREEFHRKALEEGVKNKAEEVYHSTSVTFLKRIKSTMEQILKDIDKEYERKL